MGKKAVPGVVGAGGIGPAWTHGEIEKPAGTKEMGGWTARIYTAEQQARLRVDEHGNKNTTQCMLGGAGGTGPAWTRGEIENPAGTKNMDGWTRGVYTAEQRARLGVDEEGNKKAAPGMVGGAGGIGPAWTRGEIETSNGTEVRPLDHHAVLPLGPDVPER